MDRAEVPLIEGEDVPGTVAFGEHDVRSVGQANVPEAGVTFDDGLRLRDVFRRERSQTARPTRDLVEQGDLGFPSDPRDRQIVELGGYEGL